MYGGGGLYGKKGKLQTQNHNDCNREGQMQVVQTRADGGSGWR